MKSRDRNAFVKKNLQYLLNKYGTNLHFDINNLKGNRLVLLHPIENIRIPVKDPFIFYQQREICQSEFFLVMKALYSMFIKKNDYSPFFLSNNKIVQYQSSCLDKESTFNFLSGKSSNMLGISNTSNIINLYLCYFHLLNDYNFLESMNEELLKKIKDTENIYTNSKEINFCKICLVLKEELQVLKEKYNNISKNYTVAQMEKERSVMKFATGEKRLIEAQKSIKLAEKKYQDALKQTTELQKKLQRADNDNAKLISEMNNKCSEIMQLRNQIERQKDNDNAKDMKLKWTQNRLKIITDAYEDTQAKLNETLAKNTELKNHSEILQSQINDKIKMVNKTDENKVTILDQQIKEQQARLILERHVIEDAENSRVKLQKEYDLLLDRQRNTDKENHLLISQIHNLQKECANFKSEANVLKTCLEKEKEKLQTLESQMSEMEILNKHLESKEQRLCALEIELKRLQLEKVEFQTDIEALRQREIQMLDFTQKLTDKNVQLQCDFTNLQSMYHILENNQSPLQESLNKSIEDIKNLEQNLACEKIERIKECNILVKCIAELTFYNQKLLHQFEDLEGDNDILRKRYELAIREMNREVYLRRTKTKCNKSNSDALSSKTNEFHNQNSSTNEISKNTKVDDLLDKENLYKQLIKLQKINAKRAEKLVFLEEHSHALLEELQRKTKIIQNYGIPCDTSSYGKL